MLPRPDDTSLRRRWLRRGGGIGTVEGSMSIDEEVVVSSLTTTNSNRSPSPAGDTASSALPAELTVDVSLATPARPRGTLVDPLGWTVSVRGCAGPADGVSHDQGDWMAAPGRSKRATRGACCLAEAHPVPSPSSVGIPASGVRAAHCARRPDGCRSRHRLSGSLTTERASVRERPRSTPQSLPSCSLVC